MQLSYADFIFTLLTPCFCGTALGKQDTRAEMRVPPIRGHVRFWHRTLFGPQDCNRVWGSASGNAGHGSRVSVRFIGPVSTRHADPQSALLPHKREPKERGPRPALAAGETFTLRIQRLVGCTNDDWNHAQRAVKLWLLLGSLGLRCNRASGSVWPQGDWVPQNDEDLKNALQNLGLSNQSVALIGLKKSKTAEQLRETASDTLKGNHHGMNIQLFGSSNPRTPSPIKFKVIRLDGGLCLLATAPLSRTPASGHPTLLHLAEQLLNNKPNPARWKELGAWQYLLPDHPGAILAPPE